MIEHEFVDEKEMSFFEHIEVLRWHLIRAFISIFFFAILAFIYKKILFDSIIFGPQKLDFISYQLLCDISHYLSMGDNLCIKDIGFKLTNIKMAGQFTQHLIVSTVSGFILAFPYVIWELWRFVKPALHKNERKYAVGIIFFSSLLFFVGVLFGYLILAPVTLQFLGNYRISETIQNTITLTSYISTLVSVVFATAITFEFPMVAYFLSKIGLLTPKKMRKFRKFALIISLILAAVVTPPDVVSQILLSIPFLFLYELGIMISSVIERKRLKQKL